MTIYTPNFSPTYLYIKQHSVTGKLYFGKTTKDPEKYIGSGKHWLRHIKKHGKEHVVNLWYCLFFDAEAISEFALMYSEQQNIVESKEWLNIIPENGLDGGYTGLHSNEHKRKMSTMSSGENNAMFGRSAITEQNLKWYTDGNISSYYTPGLEPIGFYRGRSNVTRSPTSEETRAKLSDAAKGRHGWNNIKVISPNNTEFNSIKEAAIHLNITISKFSHWAMREGPYKDWIILR